LKEKLNMLTKNGGDIWKVGRQRKEN